MKKQVILMGMIVGIFVTAQANAGIWNDYAAPWFKFKAGDTTPGSAALQTPTEAVKDLDKKLDDYRTGDNLTLAEKEHNRKIKEDILHTIFDVRELSRIALSKHWNNLTPKEQNDFVNLMIDLLMEKGILSKEQGKKDAKSDSVYNVQYKGDKYLDPNKTRSLSRTLVVVKGQGSPVELDYKLSLESGNWKIYDVIVEGASLMENYRYQFDAIISKNGYPDLVGRMQRKLNSFKSDKTSGT
ncbi:MAG: hypothetical protein COV45_07695 [Deltaproteobacteria bacterium CG11_big_fil_rev_8_21_14_0_20_47_16]|nr:MAG: hypothetical protein COV45_07695 [Deltaproteobacteria bacterium CG11_big_fil_rev_8_21_14_0_20_47_16]